MKFSELAYYPWYHVDTKWACGAVVTDGAGLIIAAAPIFRKVFLGEDISYLMTKYIVTPLDQYKDDQFAYKDLDDRNR